MSPTLQVDSLPAESQGKPKNTGVGNLSLFQGIFLSQESNQGLLHCRWILYQLNYQGSSALLFLALYFGGIFWIFPCYFSFFCVSLPTAGMQRVRAPPLPYPAHCFSPLSFTYGNNTVIISCWETLQWQTWHSFKSNRTLLKTRVKCAVWKSKWKGPLSIYKFKTKQLQLR